MPTRPRTSRFLFPLSSAARAALIVLACGSGPHVWACKYSVRDVTFVPRAGEKYRLAIEVPESMTGAERERLERAVRGALIDTNVTAEFTSAAVGEPRATLIAPEGRELPLAYDESAAGAFAEVAASPVRAAIVEALPVTHSIVLLVEGRDGGAPGAREAAASAIAAVTATLAELPKSAGESPRLVVIPPEERRRERVLLWALGVDPAGESTHAAVLAGRTRRVGPLLTADEVSREGLLRNLHAVGQDCECGLERSWMEGPALPHRWGAEAAARAQALLGFAPDNPLVEAEVRRILARNHPGGVAARGAREVSFDPFLGYEEVAVAPLAEAADTSAAVPADAGRVAARDESVELPLVSRRPAADAGVVPRAAGVLEAIALAITLMVAVSAAGALAVLLFARRGAPSARSPRRASPP